MLRSFKDNYYQSVMKTHKKVYFVYDRRLPMTVRGEARRIVWVKKVHRAVAVEVRRPIVRVDQHRSRRHRGHVGDCPHYLYQRGGEYVLCILSILAEEYLVDLPAR